VYCGVSPHLEATFTTSVAPSDNSASVVGLPSRVVRAMYLRVTPMTLTLPIAVADGADRIRKGGPSVADVDRFGVARLRA
jgi:hypothetical protein